MLQKYSLQVETVFPKLTLLGAGPGDPELITLKGVKVLAQAKVVMYDALVSEALLQYAPDAIHIYCGKRAGAHYMKQSEINEHIVAYAQKYGHVVRLKGGDPFVFGRGQEEIEYAAQFGIPTEIIPGVSSATALATLQRIPLTQRGTNESIWITTGTTSCGQLSKDIEVAAQSSATVVVLMGMKKLSEIVAVFKKYRGAMLPIAIIQNGSLPDERALLSTLANVESKAMEEGMASPAVIILGDVITLPA